MGTKDYEVRNRDYSSGEYHYNGNNSYGNNQYSKNDNSNFIGIIFLIFCILSGGILVALYYDFEAHTSKKDLAESKSSEQPKSSPVTSNNSSEKSKIDNSSDISNNTTSDSNSEFYNKLMKKIQKTHLNRDNNKPFGKKKTPLEIQQEEERKKRFEAKRISIFGNVKDSKESSTQNTKQEKAELSNAKPENKPVPNTPEVSKTNNVESLKTANSSRDFSDNEKEIHAEIKNFDNEFFRRRIEFDKLDEAGLIKELSDCQKFYEKYDSYLKDRYTPFISRKSQILGYFARMALNNDYSSLFQKTVECGFIPNNWTFDHLPMAFYAIKKGSSACLDIILSTGIDLNKELQYDEFDIKRGIDYKIEEGKTLLHAAAEKGYITLAKKVLEAGVPVNQKTKEGKTALDYAFNNKQYDMVDFLLKNGAQLSADIIQDNCDERMSEIFESNNNRSNADEAKPKSSEDAVKANTADVEAKPDIALEEVKANTAAVETKPKVVEESKEAYDYIKNGELINLFKLAKEGKNLADIYYNNEPAVCIAVRYDRFEILKYLIHEFDCKNLVNTENKRNALHYAVIYYNLDTVRYLLKNGFSANEKDIDGNTPLHYAVSNQLKECVSALLVNGANPNILNNKKQNALHLAVKNDNSDMVGFLLKKGANINQQDVDGNTPLHYFPLFSYDNKAMLDVFYKYEDKMDFTVNNKYGKTPRNVIQKDCFDYYEKQYKVQEIEDKSENKEKTGSSNNENKKQKIHLEKYLVFSEESSLLDAEIDFKQDNEYVFCPVGPVVIPFKPAMVRLFLAQVAIEKDHSLFLEKLLQKDFHPINEPEKFIDINTKVILSMVVYAAEKDSRKCVEVLINNGADIKMEAPKPKEKQKVLVEEGKTLLHCAAQYGDISLMKRVIDAGVPVDKKTASGKTPLYFAVKNNQYESAYILLENGAVREDSLKSETKDEKMLKLLETGK